MRSCPAGRRRSCSDRTLIRGSWWCMPRARARLQLPGVRENAAAARGWADAVRELGAVGPAVQDAAVGGREPCRPSARPARQRTRRAPARPASRRSTDVGAGLRRLAEDAGYVVPSAHALSVLQARQQLSVVVRWVLNLPTAAEHMEQLAEAIGEDGPEGGLGPLQGHRPRGRAGVRLHAPLRRPSGKRAVRRRANAGTRPSRRSSRGRTS